MYAVEVSLCGMIYIPSFMTIVTSVERILKFGCNNLKGCNVGITDGRG
jgi:hypothetical protein